MEGEFIEGLSDSALKDLRAYNDELLKTVANVSTIQKEFSKVKSPLSSNNVNKQITDEYVKQEKAIADIQIKLQRLSAAQTQSAIKDIQLKKQQLQLTKQQQQEVDRSERAMKREADAMAKAQSLYEAVRRKMTLLTAEYNDLAAKRELNGRLTDKEAQRLTFLTSKIQGYYKVIDTVNTNIGKYQQRVAQYAGAFNPLTNSVSRLAQELPNAGQSFQIFAMSIGNNIAAFKDAISDIIAQNKVLQAEGKATQNVFSQVSGALLSWNTLLYAGIALFIAYSEEIGNWVSQLFDADSALKSVSESQDAFNKSRVEGQKAVVSEQEELRRYLRIAANDKLSMDERRIALKALREQYPFYLKMLSDNQILAGQTSKAEAEITKALKAKGEAEKANEQIVKNKQRILELTEAEARSERAINEARNEAISLRQRADRALGREERSALTSQAVSAQRRYNDLLKQQRVDRKELNALETQNIANQQRIIQLQGVSIGLEYQAEKTRKERTRSERNNLEAIDAETAGTASLIKAINDQINAVEELRTANTRNFADYQRYTQTINALKKSLELITEPPTGDMGVAQLKRVGEQIEANEKALKALNAEVGEFVRGISKDFINESSLPSLAQFFDGTFERLQAGAATTAEKFAITFNAIGDIAKEVFGYINSLAQVSFEQRFEALEREKNIAIQFAGESVAARENIEKQYDERRKQIQREQAKQQQATAIFSTIVNTATAVVAALANPGGPAGVALAAVVAALGAAQIALIASQPLPEFYKGTDNAPEGWAWTQEKGRERIYDKDGNLKSEGSTGGRKITYLKKGDKVLTAEQTRRDILNESMAFNHELNGLLTSNNIDNSVVYSTKVDFDYNRMGKEFGRVMDRHPRFNLNIDKDGITTNLVKRGQTTNYINNKASGKGLIV